MYLNGVWNSGSMQTIRIKLIVKVVCFDTCHQKEYTLKFLDIIEFNSYDVFFAKIQSYQINQKLSNLWLSSVNMTNLVRFLVFKLEFSPVILWRSLESLSFLVSYSINHCQRFIEGFYQPTARFLHADKFTVSGKELEVIHKRFFQNCGKSRIRTVTLLINFKQIILR